MSIYIIQGGGKLKGSISVNSSKNTGVGLLCASLLNEGVTEFFNFPDLEETKRIIEVLESIGVKITWPHPRQLRIEPPKKFNLEAINYKAASSTRSVLMLLGVLIHKMNHFNLPKSGGCLLGARTVAPHLYALEKFGVKILSTSRYYKVSRPKKMHQEEIVLYESGDTVTENAIMASALTPAKTVIKYASANYQIQELCFFLKEAGIKIENIGSTTLTIHGIKKINKHIKYYLAEDPIEAMMFIALAATTNSSLIIKGCPMDFLELELLKLEKMGFKYDVLRKYKSKNGETKLADIKTRPSNLIAPKDKIYGRPYPGLNIDNLPFFVPIATQAKGRTLIHDWVYENRAIYYTELSKLGASLALADPHRIYIDGPTKLKSNEIVCPPALRPSVIILIAMMAAKGKSILRNTYAIDRGYEDLAGRLKSIGAKIEKISDKVGSAFGGKE